MTTNTLGTDKLPYNMTLSMFNYKFPKIKTPYEMDNLIQVYCSAHIYGQDFFLIVLLLRNQLIFTPNETVHN